MTIPCIFAHGKRHIQYFTKLGNIFSANTHFTGSINHQAIYIFSGGETKAAGGGICSLTTLSSLTNVLFIAAFLDSSTAIFCAFELLSILISFFENSFSLWTIYIRFALLLAQLRTRNSCAILINNKITLYYAARPLSFGNIQ